MKKGVILGLAMLCAIGVQAASFTNLNFEAYSGSGSDYLPGWTNNHNVCLDCFPLEGAWLGLLTTNNQYNTPLEGDASLFVGTGNLILYGLDEIWVSQTAMVPTNATQIRFLTSLLDVGASLGGLPLCTNSPVTEWSGVYSYTADIQSLAGQEAELKIVVGWSSWGRYQLDRIEFLDGSGTVIWPIPPPPPPYGPSARCLEDFHAAILNTSLWEVASEGGEIPYDTTGESLRVRVMSSLSPRETAFRFLPHFQGDWDILMDYSTIYRSGFETGLVGMALGADFGPTGGTSACVGYINDTLQDNPRYMVDWGLGPDNVVSNAPTSGMFRLVRTGEDVTGLFWDPEGYCWQTVGTAGGFTQESARVGLKVWNTGMFGGKGELDTYSDNLMLVDGQVCLDGMAVKVFGLDSNGVPSFSWDSVGIPESNRYFVMKSTNLLNSSWEAVSGALGESAESNQWTGSASDASPVYYRIEMAPAE